LGAETLFIGRERHENSRYNAFDMWSIVLRRVVEGQGAIYSNTSGTTENVTIGCRVLMTNTAGERPQG